MYFWPTMFRRAGPTENATSIKWGNKVVIGPPASKSESQQQSEHDLDQQRCRDRDDAVGG
jgi:hypothetical protein